MHLILCDDVPKTECKNTAYSVNNQIFSAFFCLADAKNKEERPLLGAPSLIYCCFPLVLMKEEGSEDFFSVKLFKRLHVVYHLNGCDGKFATFVHLCTSTFFSLLFVVHSEHTIDHRDFSRSIELH